MKLGTKMLKILTIVFVLFTIAAPFAVFAVDGGPVQLQNPIAAESFADLLADVLDVVVTIAIPIIALAIIWSGFLYVKAQGKPEKIKEANKAITYTLIGAAIILGAFVIAQTIRGTLESIQSGEGGEDPEPLSSEIQTIDYV